MVLSQDDFMNRLKTRLGDDVSDESVSFLEDMTDTYNDLCSRATGLGDAEWQKKYDDLDNSWREKYKARFFEPGTTPDDVKRSQEDDVKDDAKVKTFSDLFTEREG